MNPLLTEQENKAIETALKDRIAVLARILVTSENDDLCKEIDVQLDQLVSAATKLRI